jgi:hypothetical protein
VAKSTSKGMRGVAIDFAGKNRLLKYYHGPVGDLETRANEVLREMGAIKDTVIETPQGRRIEPGPVVFADGIFSQWLGNSKIFSLALLYGLKHEDAELTLEQVNEGIDNFTNGLTELTRAMIEAFKMARDPSSVASLKQRWQNSDEIQKMMEERQAMMEEANMLQATNSLKEAQTALQKAKKERPSGAQPSVSESNSA